jgi:hypothetical protein
VKKGDKGCIYMPMVPELPIPMLACARIGAIHSVCPSLCISYYPLILNFCGVILQMKFQEFLSDTTILINHGWNFKSFGTKEFQRTCEQLALRKNLGHRMTHVFG